MRKSRSNLNVLAVGGTNLQVDSAGNYRGEIAWTKGGGGTSTIEKAPVFQTVRNARYPMWPTTATRPPASTSTPWSP